ncbi:MAG: hypothetical protein HUU02_04215 [Bacteroidetes bacterium]|nr:hypothetical protein [Phycisphaerae bacterium]NUN68899.1 hypothetical protein [Bacteroidota bacterium]
MFFTGTSEHTIDDKNRVSIPAVHRNQLKDAPEGNLWFVVPGNAARSLRLYPASCFKEMSRAIEGGWFAPEEVQEFEDTLMAFAERAEVDSAGRIVLPAGHVRRANLGREVTIAGSRDHLTIHDREAFATQSDEKWRDYPDTVRKARQAAKSRWRQPGREAGGGNGPVET